MKKLLLKSKNHIAKLFLATLGFTLAASQCLAQYMAYIPKTVIYGNLKGVTDTISKFQVVVNNYDTLYSGYYGNYTFRYVGDERADSVKIEVIEYSDEANKKYHPVTKIVAIKPEEENSDRAITIELKEKK